MMIVVEGPDGSGKTSLIERLQASMDLELRPRAVGSDTEYRVHLDEWVIEELRAYDESDDDFIYDRHQLISHLMYGPLMRRTLYGGFMVPNWLTSQLRFFWQRKPIVIVCLPPVEAVLSNMATDPHKVEDIEVYYWNYFAWYCMNQEYPSTYHMRNIVLWDYTTMDFDDLLNTIQRLERANT